MGNIITSKLFHSILLFTVIGEFFLPWILCRYYDGCNSKTMAMSALGSLQSPVRAIYNTWLICFPLYCPKCKQEMLIEAKHLKVTVIDK